MNGIGEVYGMHGRGEKSVQGFGGKYGRKKTFGRPMHRWDYGIRVDLEEIGCGGVEWIHLAQYMFRWRAVVNAVMNLSLLAPRSQSVQTRYKKY
jgi:hypothetical protein